MRSAIGKWGNSLGLRIPKHIVEELSLQPNDEVECRVEKGRLIVEVIQKRKYSLEELLSQEIEPEPEIDWGKPMGEEVW
ncbi:AbrB/MazE/SpoVT family DNA-binding domain-containing protein [Chroococcidiopsis sp. FACHB-1243]|uniref:AbrB/MazE/SpoVT family DNA-binding domain-containing protein n=1 Tax=Chroococcidiopsis sp. [FACHB-1243] TaxID=2692781 RepID=UPI001780DC9A|nr:AbrB/MazE/SpoVT family DNA-binding domain-containing protein [Chroococcidiopsis sp. [FACHB-1243]]MBD2305232.1 AbrB/MazE/SpoVT family DNA-binding domain-containing protein [Chroococcidiopsis sp. [FACHB-1243]]